jgi:hypothetical protein
MNTFVAQEEINRVGATARPLSRNWFDWKLWLQWAFANVAGEVLGLGLAGVVATVVVLTVGEPETTFVALMMAGATTLCHRSGAVGVGECGGVGGRDAVGIHRRRGIHNRRIGAEHNLDSGRDCRRRRSFCRRDPRRGAAVAAATAAVNSLSRIAYAHPLGQNWNGRREPILNSLEKNGFHYLADIVWNFAQILFILFQQNRAANGCAVRGRILLFRAANRPRRDGIVIQAPPISNCLASRFFLRSDNFD